MHRGERDPLTQPIKYKTEVINDPLDQTYGFASSDHYVYLKIVLLGEILNSGNGRTDHYR